MKKLPKKMEVITYKEKTNFPVGSGPDIFVNFFNQNDIEKIVSNVFKSESQVDAEHLCKLLNNVLVFSNHTNFTKLNPGRSDKRKLIEEICILAQELGDHLYILLNRYGYETYNLIPIFIGAPKVQKANCYEFLTKLEDDLNSLSAVVEVAKRNIDEVPGKKTGNNSQNSIPTLIYNLGTVYEELTQKKARDNFQQDPLGDVPFKGQFYDFCHYVFEIINKNFKIRCLSTEKPNPFRMDFINKNGDKSYSLGRYIRKVLLLSEKFAK